MNHREFENLSAREIMRVYSANGIVRDTYDRVSNQNKNFIFDLRQGVVVNKEYYFQNDKTLNDVPIKAIELTTSDNAEKIFLGKNTFVDNIPSNGGTVANKATITLVDYNGKVICTMPIRTLIRNLNDTKYTFLHCGVWWERCFLKFYQAATVDALQFRVYYDKR